MRTFARIAEALTVFFAGCILAFSALAGELRDAVKAGDMVKVQELLSDGHSPDEQGLSTPLYLASDRGMTTIAGSLLESGADPNNLTKWGGPLHIASRRGHIEIVQILLDKGADPNLRGGENNRTPLIDAAIGGSAEVAQLLIDYGADVNLRSTGRDKGPPIHYAVMRNKEDVRQVLLENGARPNPVKPITRNEFEAVDLEYGKALAAGCTPCHTFEPNDTAERGPTLWNIVGREVAAVPDFPYTEPMRAIGGTWDYERLNQFIADVPATVPGTAMYTGSVPDREKRIAIIAWLRTLSDEPAPLPKQ